MSEHFELQPFKLSFINYHLNSSLINKFENLFCGKLGFIKSNSDGNMVKSQRLIYHKNTARYIISPVQEKIFYQLSGVGIHLKSKNDIGLDHNKSVEIYVNDLIEKNPLAEKINNDEFPIMGVKIAGIKFYFTTKKDFQPGGFFYKSKPFEICKPDKVSMNEKQNYNFELDRKLQFYHHHAAFYLDSKNKEILDKFFMFDLGMQTQKSYILRETQLHVTPFALNQVRLNIIEQLGLSHLACEQHHDLYSHAALGTTNIIQFAKTIIEASKLPENGVELLPPIGNNSDMHHQQTHKMYSHLLSEEEISELKRHHINFDADLENVNNYGLQFFFKSVLGLGEGIYTQGNFEFLPRAGEGATQGILDKLMLV